MLALMLALLVMVLVVADSEVESDVVIAASDVEAVFGILLDKLLDCTLTSSKRFKHLNEYFNQYQLLLINAFLLYYSILYSFQIPCNSIMSVCLGAYVCPFVWCFQLIGKESLDDEICRI